MNLQKFRELIRFLETSLQKLSSLQTQESKLKLTRNNIYNYFLNLYSISHYVVKKIHNKKVQDKQSRP
jgi:conjugal transfer/entry exclusion protein